MKHPKKKRKYDASKQASPAVNTDKQWRYAAEKACKANNFAQWTLAMENIQAVEKDSILLAVELGRQDMVRWFVDQYGRHPRWFNIFCELLSAQGNLAMTQIISKAPGLLKHYDQIKFLGKCNWTHRK